MLNFTNLQQNVFSSIDFYDPQDIKKHTQIVLLELFKDDTPSYVKCDGDVSLKKKNQDPMNGNEHFIFLSTFLPCELFKKSFLSK